MKTVTVIMTLMLFSLFAFSQGATETQKLSLSKLGKTYNANEPSPKLLFGFHVGINGCDVLGVNFYDKRPTILPSVGINVHSTLNDHFSAQLGFNYTPKGHTVNYNSIFTDWLPGNTLYRFDQLEMPLVLQYNFRKNARKSMYVNTGVVLSYQIGEPKLMLGCFDALGDDVIFDWGFGAQVGVGYFWDNGRLPQKLELRGMIESYDLYRRPFSVSKPLVVGVNYYLYCFGQKRG